MTGWGRRRIAAIGFGILIAVLLAILVVEGLSTLCISENATCASPPPEGVLLLPPLTVVAGYAVTVWRAQLTPVLLSGIVVIPEAVVIGLIW